MAKKPYSPVASYSDLKRVEGLINQAQTVETIRKLVVKDGPKVGYKAFCYMLCGKMTPEAMKPDEAFAYSWASVLLDEVLDEVQKDCSQAGKETYWAVFCARVLEPIMDNSEPKPLSELCKQLGIDSETKASNMIVTVKRRFQAAMRRRLCRHVNSEKEVKQEIGDLMKILSKTHST